MVAEETKHGLRACYVGHCNGTMRNYAVKCFRSINIVLLYRVRQNKVAP